jgi:hypothetical protein
MPANATVKTKSGDLELVVLTKSEYESLRFAADYYNALRDAGVDNWSGYDYANEIMFGNEEDEDDQS